MIDVDALITRELEELVPIDAEPDWQAVVAAAALPARRRRRVALTMGVAVCLVAVVVATPLGAAIARGVGGFSDWLAGHPGTPASRSAQKSFAAANAHSWLGFPRGTQLRHLSTAQAAGATVTLYGFRAGSSLCLQVTVRGSTRGRSTNCVPLADLERRDAPVRVVTADQPFGTGSKHAWYGLDRLHSSLLQITAGVVADDVPAVVLRDNGGGRHVVPTVADAFLYVAANPQIGERVVRIWAKRGSRLVAVPFVPTPFGFGGGRLAARVAPAVHVAAPAVNGRIAWVERREKRGEPLSVLPTRLRHELLGFRGGGGHDRIVFGRVLTPDPARPLRVIVTMNAHRHGGRIAGICTTTAFRGGGAGGGCAPYPDVFAKSPVTAGEFYGGSQQVVEVSGIVSDAVSRLRVLLANRQWVDVPLRDNTYAVELPIAHLPARVVAYDSLNRVVGTTGVIDNGGASGPTQAPGKAKELLAVRGPHGAHAELFVGPATNGGSCLYIKHYFSKTEQGAMEGCSGRAWRGSPLRLSTEPFPPIFVEGQVRHDVAAVRVEYADHTASTIRPVRGYVLETVDREHRTTATRPLRFVALSASGAVLGVEKLPPAPRR
jgi:hypothetical protein